MRGFLHERITEAAQAIGKAARADCEVCIERGYDVTINDLQLTHKMLPTLARVAGADQVRHIAKVTGSEDFSCFQQVVPGLFIFLGVTPPGRDAETAEPNHSPRFFVDEGALPLGVRALAHLACDWLEASDQQRRFE
jgi:amidohydrolase